MDNYFSGSEAGRLSLPMIRELCPTLPILFLTTADFSQELLNNLKPYNVNYIQKPISAGTLIYTVMNMRDHEKPNDIAELKRMLTKIETKIDDLTSFVKHDLTNMIKQEKYNLALPDNFDDDDLKNDALIYKFITKLSKYININMDRSDSLINEEQDDLKKRFGPYWSKLLDTTRASLISAAVIWKRCADIVDTKFDYSGVCISATSALEIELKKIFFDDFKAYIVKTYCQPSETNWRETFDIWPELLLDTTKEKFEQALAENSTPQIHISNDFTMGTLPYLFGRQGSYVTELQSKMIHTRMNEYLATIVKRKYIDSPILAFSDESTTSFIQECSKIRKKFRNPAAHLKSIDKSNAKTCLDKIAGEFGLLIALYHIIE